MCPAPLRAAERQSDTPATHQPIGAPGTIASPLVDTNSPIVSGAIISLSHSFEPLFPPRAGDPFRWVPVREYVFGTPQARTSTATAALRALRVGSFALIGWFDEVWASPRLLSYNVLRIMLSAGYAPKLRAMLDDRARRAWASGNPALDYVGIGGGTFLAPPYAR